MQEMMQFNPTTQQIGVHYNC